MSLTRLINLSSKLLILLGFTFFFEFQTIGNEPVDIWKQEKSKTKEELKKEDDKGKSTIDFSKEDKNLGQIKITDNNNNLESPEELLGLYDPEKNDLNLTMWSNTKGSTVRDTFKRIEKIKLSNFSEKIFINTIFTYSYAPKDDLSKDDFLKLKLNWLINNNKIDLVEEFLNMT